VPSNISNSTTSKSIIPGSGHPHTPPTHAAHPSQTSSTAIITTPSTGHRSCNNRGHSKQLVRCSDSTSQARPAAMQPAVLQQLPQPDMLTHHPGQADNCSCSCLPAGRLQVIISDVSRPAKWQGNPCFPSPSRTHTTTQCWDPNTCLLHTYQASMDVSSTGQRVATAEASRGLAALHSRRHKCGKWHSRLATRTHATCVGPQGTTRPPHQCSVPTA
jgi:hypothetical protein